MKQVLSGSSLKKALDVKRSQVLFVQKNCYKFPSFPRISVKIENEENGTKYKNEKSESSFGRSSDWLAYGMMDIRHC